MPAPSRTPRSGDLLRPRPRGAPLRARGLTPGKAARHPRVPVPVRPVPLARCPRRFPAPTPAALGARRAASERAKRGPFPGAGGC